MNVAELLDLDVPAGAEGATVSIPVPADLLWVLDERPAEFGLVARLSRRQMLHVLVMKGATVAASERRAAERERLYVALGDDGERAAVAVSIGDELVEDGIL